MNRYDTLNQLIKNWSSYLALHRKVYKNKHMPDAWYNRLDKIEAKIYNWNLEKSLIGELNT